MSAEAGEREGNGVAEFCQHCAMLLNSKCALPGASGVSLLPYTTLSWPKSACLEGVELCCPHQLQRTLKGQPYRDARNALAQPHHLQHSQGVKSQ